MLKTFTNLLKWSSSFLSFSSLLFFSCINHQLMLDSEIAFIKKFFHLAFTFELISINKEVVHHSMSIVDSYWGPSTGGHISVSCPLHSLAQVLLSVWVMNNQLPCILQLLATLTTVSPHLNLLMTVIKLLWHYTHVKHGSSRVKT